MATQESQVVLSFNMKGQVEYANTLKQINQVMNIAAKEYKAHIEAMGKEASETDKLRAVKEKLEIQLEGAKKRTELLTKEYENMKNKTDSTTYEINRLYGQLVDAQKAELKFENQLKSTNDSLSEQAEESRNNQLELENLKEEQKSLQSEIKRLNSEFKLQSAQLGENATETEKAELAQKQYAKQAELVEKQVRTLEKRLELVKKEFGENSEEANQLEVELNSVKVTFVNLSNSINKSSESIDSATDEMSKLKEEEKLLQSEFKRLNSEFKLQSAQLGENATETEKAELAQKQYAKQAELVEKQVRTLEKQLELVKKEFGENSKEVKDMEAELNDAKTTFINLGKEIKNIGDSSEEAESGMRNLGDLIASGIFMDVSEKISEISDKLKEIGQAAMEGAMDAGDAQSKLQANLGLTSEQVDDLKVVMYDVFNQGVVGSMEEAGEAVTIVKQSFSDLNNIDLSNITNSIVGIADKTGTDVKENTIAAEKLMNSFGLTGEEALNLIASGFQKGLNKTDDFLDTLNEYSPHFQSAGYSAQEMLEIIDNGMKNGAMNTDKAADAVKEFQIRLGDGSFESVISTFSNDTKKVLKEWQNGKATVADVAESVGNDLNKMSPTEQQKALSVLSSQFEDLGIKGAEALFSIGEEFQNTTGKAKELSNQTPGQKWEGSIREIKEALQPFGDDILTAMTIASDGIGKVLSVISNMPAPFRIVIEVFGLLIACVGIVLPIFATLSAAAAVVGTSIGGLIASFLPVVGIVAGIVAGITLLISGFLYLWNNVEGFRQFWISVWNAIVNNISTAIEYIKPTLQEIGDKLEEVFTKCKEVVFTVLEIIWGKIQSFINLTKPLWQGFWEQIKNVLKTVWDIISSVVKGAIDIISGIIDVFMGIITGDFERVGEGIRKIWDALWNTIGSIIKSGVDFVVNSINNLVSSVIGFFSNLWTSASEKFGAIGDAMVHPIETAKEKIKSIIKGIKDFIKGLTLKFPKFHMPPLPHFGLEGKFSLVPPSVPKIKVDWYAKGGIFTKPTIFGASNGRLQGAGEAGPEAAIPLNADTLGKIGRGIASTMKLDNREIHVHINLDGKEIAIATAPILDDINIDRLNKYDDWELV